MSESRARLPVRPASRLERLLWLIAALLAWAFVQAGLATLRASARNTVPAETRGVWIVLPVAAVGFEIWVVASALRLRRRTGQEHAVELGSENISLPPFGLSRRGAVIRYEDVSRVERRGFGGAARLVIRHRGGRSVIPVAQVNEKALLQELALRLPEGMVPVSDED